MPVKSPKKAKKLSSSPKKELPRIYRFITEKKLMYAKLAVFGFITTLLIAGIVVKLVELRQGTQAIRINASLQHELFAEKGYWEDVLKRHPGYRDAAFKLAVVTYRLGLKNDAKKYIDLTLQIDPNFTQGRVFAQKLNL